MTRSTVAAILAVFTYVPSAGAGTVTVDGNCLPLTDASQMGGITGQATFNEGPVDTDVPTNQYSAQGMTFRTGALTAILPGVTAPGSGRIPWYRDYADMFPLPIGGNGTYSGLVNSGGGAVIFDVDVHRFGLTVGKNGDQYITVWDEAGVMMGQVTWDPSSDAGFAGIAEPRPSRCLSSATTTCGRTRRWKSAEARRTRIPGCGPATPPVVTAF